ncbi:hypothetical protein [Parasitella parasitica]|uniref:Reverse transcriptase zinc-binding domain-containing protein n=1 Tax=Parasitella parasitica TaxID=35722 RepID=A0A0B7MWF5_9FUNG|nr:hypothetical protein [Parasitella parasitica]
MSIGQIQSALSAGSITKSLYTHQCCDSNPHSYLDPTFPPTLRSFCSSLRVPSTLAPSSSSSHRPRRIPLNSITYYRSLLPPLPLPSSLSSSTTQWSRLWSLAILLSSRTVWYRALHSKLPTKSLLHRLMSQQHSSPFCALCSDQVEEDLHQSFSLVHLNSRFGGLFSKPTSLHSLSLTMILSINWSPSWLALTPLQYVLSKCLVLHIQQIKSLHAHY